MNSCPHCGCDLGVEKGGLSLPDSLDRNTTEQSLQKETPKSPKRGKAREYTEYFELAWKAYGRKDQKFEAFGIWVLRAREVGGEASLLTLVLSALKWQSSSWAEEGWKFAPYFERYLKRRKWEDERPPAPVARIAPGLAPSTAALNTVDRKLAEFRAAQSAPPLDPNALRTLRGGK